jgi:hypothetical protein
MRKGSKVDWPWIIAGLGILIVVPLFAFGVQTGECIDYTAESGAESFCTLGPTVGNAGAWVLTVAAALFCLYAVRRALRRRP